MDSPEIDIDQVNKSNQRQTTTNPCRLLWRLVLAIVFTASIFILTLLSILHLAVYIENFSIRSPISVPSRCRIVSSSVDLRSSKVEYIDNSGKARSAFAEAPNEALPSECRPNFGDAWLAKKKFKVNETYKCCYDLGISKVKINQEGLFNCRAEDPSTVEMLKRYSILLIRIMKLSLSSWASLNQWRWDMIAGLITGFASSLFSLGFPRLISPLISIVRRLNQSTLLAKRFCVSVLYFSFMSWWAVQYLKRIGLS